MDRHRPRVCCTCIRAGSIDFSVADGLSGDFIRSIFEDREGSVWVSTSTGIDRFREFAIPTISVNEGGLSTCRSHVLQATADGSIWILNGGWVESLAKRADDGLRQAKCSEAKTSEQISESAIINARVTEIANSGLRGKPSIRSGRTIGDDCGLEVSEGVFYFDRGRFVQVPGVPGGDISSIAGDEQGKVWISSLDQGLFSSTPEGTIQRIPWDAIRTHAWGGSFAA